MKDNLFDRLFIFELANNHSGDVEWGIETIRSFAEVKNRFDFRFAFKFQYRNIPSFIHPDYHSRMDIKHVKRFKETALNEEDFLKLKYTAEQCGFLTICTPFDEDSVDKIVKQKYDVLKIASCSFTDWPLLERIANTDLPIIASTAGASVDEMDRVITFFENRAKKMALMHCVGEYPTVMENLQLNQIDFLKKRYPFCTVGFSTHEEPDNVDSVKMAIAKGAKVFERHVAAISDKYPINAYSSTPEQVGKWLEAAKTAYAMLGIEGDRHVFSEKERNDLRSLKRGGFAKSLIKSGEKIEDKNVFYAIPCVEGQLTANDMSKYAEYVAKEDIAPNGAVLLENVSYRNLRENVLDIVNKLKDIILKAHIALPEKVELEISHHYGIEKFYEWGAAILNCINREYCKKLIILLPRQKHPSHHHVKKEETFYVLYGSMKVMLANEEKHLSAGDTVTVPRGANHDFSTDEGVIFEEISTTHFKDDSFYEDAEVSSNKDRKTPLTFRSEWLKNEIK